MSGSTFGTVFRLTTWGESHGKAVGVVVDGCPAGLPLEEADIQKFLDRRRPGQSPYATARRETDQVQILSGVFEGRTTGTPISLMIANEDQHSKDYSELASCYRPGHADYSYDAKYGFRDYRGGGRSSGRETAGRVAAGAIAHKVLESLGISFLTYTKSIGPVCIEAFDPEQITQNPLCMPDADAAARAQEYLDACRERQDSAGGTVECRISHVPAGIGEPVFEKLDAAFARALMSIGAVKSVEIGDGAASAGANGSTNNDALFCEDGVVSKKTNHAGGILGGISDGSEILLRAAFKPTPSIAAAQDTVNRDGENIQISIKGRHDPVIVPRAVVVVESMAAVTLLDLMLQNLGCTMDHLHKIYDPES